MVNRSIIIAVTALVMPLIFDVIRCEDDCNCEELLVQCFKSVQTPHTRVTNCARAYKQCQNECKQEKNVDEAVDENRKRGTPMNYKNQREESLLDNYLKYLK